MENYVSCHGWCFNSDDLADIFEDDQAVWQVFPEEAGIQVELNFSVACRNHRKWHSTVAQIGVKYALQTALVLYLSVVHSAYPLLQWHHLVQIYLRIPSQYGILDKLDLIIQGLYLVRAYLI